MREDSVFRHGIVMAGWRQPIELAVNDVEVAALKEISRSRSEPAIRVQRARILLAYRESLSFFAVGHAVGVHHQAVQRCVERAAVEGPMGALDHRSPPGSAPTITAEAKAWIKDLACRKAKELGYPHELWTTRLLAGHAREHGPTEGHGCLAKLAQGTLCKYDSSHEIDVLGRKVASTVNARGVSSARPNYAFRRLTILAKAAIKSSTIART
jgi:hypothetical protein